jgi:hypothetical protein
MGLHFVVKRIQDMSKAPQLLIISSSSSQDFKFKKKKWLCSSPSSLFFFSSNVLFEYRENYNLKFISSSSKGMHNATSLFFVSFNFSFCKTFVYVIFWNVKSVEFFKSVKWECLTWCNQVLARSGHSNIKKVHKYPS